MVTAAISYRNNIFKKNVRRSFPPHQEDIPGRFAQHMAFMSNYNDDDDDDELLDGMVDKMHLALFPAGTLFPLHATSRV